MKFQIEKLAIVALSVCTIACFTSYRRTKVCIRKLMKKQAQAKTDQTEVKTEEPEPVKIAPVTTTTTTKKTRATDEKVNARKSYRCQRPRSQSLQCCLR